MIAWSGERGLHQVRPGMPGVAGLRFLLLLGGDIEPRPGPAGVPRGELDLAAGFSRATAERMSKCMNAFAQWVRAFNRL